MVVLLVLVVLVLVLLVLVLVLLVVVLLLVVVAVRRPGYFGAVCAILRLHSGVRLLAHSVLVCPRGGGHRLGRLRRLLADSTS